jgi:hypothetical protein
MRGACCVYGVEKNIYWVLVGKPEERDATWKT